MFARKLLMATKETVFSPINNLFEALVIRKTHSKTRIEQVPGYFAPMV